MKALTVNGKQLFAASSRQVELLYYPEVLINNMAIFPGDGNTIYAGEYEFRVNVPDAAYVYGRNVPGMDQTPIPIVNGVAKWTNPEDFTVWNTSIYFLCLLPEDYTSVYPDVDALDVTLTPSNFMLLNTDVPVNILGYEEQVTKYTRFMWRWDGLVSPGVFQMGAIRLNSIDLPYTYVTYGKGGGTAIQAQMPEKMVAAIVGQEENHKWCVSNWYSNLWGWLIFDTPTAIVPTKYELQIAGDTTQNPGRNPTRTRLYASTGTPTTFDDASWELLVDSNAVLPTTNYAWTTVWSE